MKKEALLALTVGMSSLAAVAGGPHGGPHGGWGHHGGGHYSFWGRGGCHFWPGFIGGAVGAVGGLVSGAVWGSPRVVYGTPVVSGGTPVVSGGTPVVYGGTPVVYGGTPVVQTQPIVVRQSDTQRIWVEGRYVKQQLSDGTVFNVWEPGHYESLASTPAVPAAAASTISVTVNNKPVVLGTNSVRVVEGSVLINSQGNGNFIQALGTNVRED